MAKHPVVHFEIGCQDGERARQFFAKLFDWQVSGRNAGFMISPSGGAGPGGHIAELAAEWGNYVTVYVEVEHLETYLERIADLGGKVLVPPVTLPGQGRFAWFAAPEGNIIGLWEAQAEPNE